jgi:hypothetical protein
MKDRYDIVTAYKAPLTEEKSKHQCWSGIEVTTAGPSQMVAHPGDANGLMEARPCLKVKVLPGVHQFMFIRLSGRSEAYLFTNVRTVAFGRGGLPCTSPGRGGFIVTIQFGGACS